MDTDKGNRMIGVVHLRRAPKLAKPVYALRASDLTRVWALTPSSKIRRREELPCLLMLLSCGAIVESRPTTNDELQSQVDQSHNC